MSAAFAATVLSAVAAMTWPAAPASACPSCRVAGGDLSSTPDNKTSAGGAAATDVQSADGATTQPGESLATDGAAPDKPFPVRFALNVDITNAYFHHGYMQQDRGLIVQPGLTLSTQPMHAGGWRVEPYVSWWNSIHSEESPGYAGGHGNHTRVEQEYQQYLDQPHAGNPLPHYHPRLVDVIKFDDAGGGWFETEIKPGVLLTNGPFALDLQLRGRIFPTDFHDTMIDVGAKATFDFAYLWDQRDGKPFSLKWINAIHHELKDDNGDEETVIETTLEPVWRFHIAGQRAAVSVPVTLGMSPNGYYRDSGNADEALGYLFAGIDFSYQLPIRTGDAKWFVTAGVGMMELLADSTQFANGGDEREVIGTVGLGVSF